jgi:hypothetical protein
MSDELEIGNIENYHSDKGGYSHSAHIDICVKRCIFCGGKELCEGFNETTIDGRGNTKIVYKEDTRKAFIESVKTLKMNMICDFDEEAKKNIKEIMLNIKEIQTQLLKEQMVFWNNLNYVSKENFMKKNNTIPNQISFNESLPFYNMFIEKELNKYRELFEELMLLSKRGNHYSAEDFEA